jgi:uncharacterized protein YegP (UPF0339 family)
MYQFKIKKQDDGGYRFELDAIKMIITDFTITEGTHQLINATKAIAYFNIGDSIYGVSNDLLKFPTAEAFYDAIIKQYEIFTGGSVQPNPAIEVKSQKNEAAKRKGNDGMMRSA